VFTFHLSPYQFGVAIRGGCEAMVHGIKPLWMPILIGWCFKLTVQMFLTSFRVKPFFRNFQPWGGSCPNFFPLFLLSMAFKFLYTSIIILHHKLCRSFFHLWAHGRRPSSRAFLCLYLFLCFALFFEGFPFMYLPFSSQWHPYPWPWSCHLPHLQSFYFLIYCYGVVCSTPQMFGLGFI